MDRDKKNSLVTTLEGKFKMKSYHVLFVALGLLGVILFYVIWNVGMLKPVVIEEVSSPQGVAIFRKYTGPYHEVRHIFENIESELEKQNLNCDTSFGRYYDDPDQVEPDRLRADIGCVLPQAPAQPIAGLETENWPGYKSLRGTFEGAPWLTAFKVYSALRRESFQRNIHVEFTPVLEVYQQTPSGFKTEVYFRIL